MLLKLKEKHKLSHTAVDEVIQIVGIVTDHVVTETLAAEQSAKAYDMDVSAPCLKNLPTIIESISNPLSSLGTSYRRKSYVAKHFPYVVSMRHLLLIVWF